MGRFRLIGLLAAVLVFSSACSSSPEPVAKESPPDVTTAPGPSPSHASPAAAPDELPPGVSERPPWLEERKLELDERGFGIAGRIPTVLRDRRLVSREFLPPPATRRYVSSTRKVPRSVLERSTWSPRCPVTIADLRYVRVAFWGFDREPHTGELLVHRSAARDLVGVFRSLYRARWPIEEMRVTSRRELYAHPTGDGNNTSAFVCRPSRLSDSWSEHAYGKAVDVNPFHNPYVRDDLVLPELARAYRDRDRSRPGMIVPGDVATRAFARIGWGWGGEWSSSKDWMHFSASGR